MKNRFSIILLTFMSLALAFSAQAQTAVTKDIVTARVSLTVGNRTIERFVNVFESASEPVATFEIGDIWSKTGTDSVFVRSNVGTWVLLAYNGASGLNEAAVSAIVADSLTANSNGFATNAEVAAAVAALFVPDSLTHYATQYGVDTGKVAIRLEIAAAVGALFVPDSLTHYATQYGVDTGKVALRLEIAAAAELQNLASVLAEGSDLAANETVDYTGTTFGIRDDDAFYRLLFSNVGETVQILTKDGDGRISANANGTEMGHDDVGYVNIDGTDGSATFTDNRATKIGLELLGYGEDGAGDGGVYGDLKPNALVPKAYVDAEILSAAPPIGGESISSQRESKWVFFDDLTHIVASSGTTIGDNAKAQTAVTNSGQIDLQDTTQTQPNIVSLSTGTSSSTGDARLYFPALYQKQTSDYFVEFMIKTEGIATFAGLYDIYVGLSSTGTQGNDGMFIYNKAAYMDDEWHTWTTNGGAGSELPTGVFFSADTWYKFRIEYDHSPTPTVNYYINGALVQSTTTNICPEAVQPFCMVRKNNAAAKRVLLVDWIYMERPRSY